MSAYTIIMLRHGESTWNRENRFTGWTDVGLSEGGVEEAHTAARLMLDEGLTYDVVHTSVQRRAIETTFHVLDRMDLLWVPVRRHWRLNERHYGALQGLNKKETAERHGQEQVFTWRRGYDVRPPALDEDDDWHARNCPAYSSVPPDLMPATESLQDVVERMLPYWHDAIFPDLRDGKRVLISAHGNSLRALVKHLDRVPDDVIPTVNIPTGIPLVYALDEQLTPAGSRYLGDPEAARAAAEAVARQAG